MPLRRRGHRPLEESGTFGRRGGGARTAAGRAAASSRSFGGDQSPVLTGESGQRLGPTGESGGWLCSEGEFGCHCGRLYMHDSCAGEVRCSVTYLAVVVFNIA